MKRRQALCGAFVILGGVGCSSSSASTRETPASTGAQGVQTKNDAPPPASPSAQEQAEAFLKAYLVELEAKETTSNAAYWTASNSGKDADYAVSAAADLALNVLHSDARRFQQVQRLLELRAELQPLTVRSLEVAERAFKANQLPRETLEEISKAQAEIDQILSTYRVELGGRKLTHHELLEILGKEKNGKKRQAAWEATRAVGQQVAPRILALVKVRNQAARTLGFSDYWDMQVRLQDHDPAVLLALFDELEKVTDKPYQAMKAQLDAEVARRFRIKPTQVMPWHYTHPFFHSAPPSSTVDMDVFYKAKTKEDIVTIAKGFFADIGLDVEPIVARSDLFERSGKDLHAYCTTIDRRDDVRMLLNIRPTHDGMETTLHELGHAVYFAGMDRELPYNLREPAHLFTTEAVAMMLGALARNPVWMVRYAGANEKKIKKAEKEILEQRRREQLILVRWGMVMFHFERALYANPEQDLNKAWYDAVERYQRVTRPNRMGPDWAAKPHVTISPVSSHNYVLGEVYAAQIRATLARMANHNGPTASLSFNGRKDFGDFLKGRLFKAGASQKWPELVQATTGAPLSSAMYAAEVGTPLK